MRWRSEKCVTEGSKYAHWIGLYLSFHLNWVLGPFVHRRLQILQTSEVTFARVITPLGCWWNDVAPPKREIFSLLEKVAPSWGQSQLLGGFNWRALLHRWFAARHSFQSYIIVSCRLKLTATPSPSATAVIDGAYKLRVAAIPHSAALIKA